MRFLTLDLRIELLVMFLIFVPLLVFYCFPALSGWMVKGLTVASECSLTY